MVKEPLPSEWWQFRHGINLFGYLHLVGDSALVRGPRVTGVEVHAFERVTDNRGLAKLAAMSDIARRAAVIKGTSYYLAQGSSTVLGSREGVPPARVVVIDMGVAGTMAVQRVNVEVTGIDVNFERLRQFQFDGTASSTQASSPSTTCEILEQADLVSGFTLFVGARALLVVIIAQVGAKRKGSVIMDLAIDQGGCVEISRPTSLSNPAYQESGVIHYCVTSVPEHLPRTTSRPPSAAIAPRVHQLTLEPNDCALSGSLNVSDRLIGHPAVAVALFPSPLVAHERRIL